MMIRCLLVFLAMMLCVSPSLAGVGSIKKPAKGIPTLGGRQFWGDVIHFRGWRIQKNTFTGHHRLIDPKDRRHEWGKLKTCLAALEKAKKTHGLKPDATPAVLLIPGIGRSSKALKAITASVKEGGFQPVPFDYPSTREGILDHAKYLKSVIDHLEGPRKIYIISHSMGGLISRTYLAGKVGKPDARVKRLIMIGTPNKGAKMANLVKDWPLYQWVWGKSGQQLAKGKDAFVAKLPAPGIEFAVIAGGRGNKTGYNPLIPGDNDGLVEVESVRLPGAADYAFVKAHHGSLLRDETVKDYCVRFLKSGAFRKNGKRQPIK